MLVGFALHFVSMRRGGFLNSTHSAANSDGGALFLKAGGSPDEYRAGLDRAIAKGWLIRHESGTYVKFTEAGAALFA